ncbi:MAG: type I restriction endonuclease [Bacteroidetes bacterium]|nr:type I restriction endonuclease [Bacteroidota bacterium]
MKQKLNSAIETIKEIKDISQFDEQATKQTIVLKILSILGWDIFNRDEIFPEYFIDDSMQKRVDYALRIKNSNKVFIEVKRIKEEDLDKQKHQEQLLTYSFSSGVPLAILTNGLTWWFYIPLKEGDWKQRKFFTIDLKIQNSDEISEKLICFLSKENTENGNALRSAEDSLQGQKKQIAINESFPVVWKNLLAKPSVDFIQLLSDETEKYCGFRPTDDFVVNSLNENNDIKEVEEDQYEDNSKSDVSTGDNARAEHTILKVIFPNGKIINENKAIDTFIESIREFGIDRVRKLPVISGAPLISDKPFNVGVKKKYKQFSGTPYYININHGTQLKKDYLEKISKALNEKITVQIESKA